MNFFDWNYAWSILPSLLVAAENTIYISIMGFIIAVTLGFFIAIARRSRNKFISWPVSAVIEFIRSTPLLIQIYVLYYVLPNYGISMTAMQCGVLAIGVHYACYLSEVYRSGLDNIPRHQWEAITALNIKSTVAYRRIIIPQAIKPILPPMGNYLIAILKDTPVLSAITVVEIMLKAKNLGSESFRYLEPVTMVGIFFMCISILLSVLVRKTENHLESSK